jgi:Flp pilus assembly protein TadD
VRLQDHAAYSEPPLWYYPVRDSLGAALLRSGAASEAATVFNADLQHTPNNARAYAGLAAAYGALHRAQDAAAAQAKYHESSQLADATLTLADL